MSLMQLGMSQLFCARFAVGCFETMTIHMTGPLYKHILQVNPIIRVAPRSKALCIKGVCGNNVRNIAGMAGKPREMAAVSDRQFASFRLIVIMLAMDWLMIIIDKTHAHCRDRGDPSIPASGDPPTLNGILTQGTPAHLHLLPVKPPARVLYYMLRPWI